MLGVVVPAVFGLITGLMLGVSEPVYLVLNVLGIGGGYFAGLEHRTPGEGFLRGVNGGLLFGVFILFGHEFSGMEPKAHLPEPRDPARGDHHGAGRAAGRPGRTLTRPPG